MKTVFVILVFLLISLIILLKWLKWRKRASKAGFALTTVAALVTCLIAFLSATSLDLPNLIEALIFSQLDITTPVKGQEITTLILSAVITVVVCLSILKFAKSALESWEGHQESQRLF